MDLIDSTLAEFAENDLKELWDSDYYAEALRAASETDWAGVLESSGMGGANGVVLNDRLMTEASLGVISQLSSLGSLSTLGSISTILAAQQQEAPTVKVEHSYSLSSERSEADSSLSDLESECFPAIPISEAEGSGGGVGGGGSTSSTSSTTSSTSSSTSSSTTSKNSIASAHTPQETSDKDPLSLNTIVTSASVATAPGSSKKVVGPPPLSPLVGHERTAALEVTHAETASATAFLSNAVLNVPTIKTTMGLVRPSAVVVTQRSGTGMVHSPSTRLSVTSRTLKLPTTSTLTISSPSASSSSSTSTASSSDTGFYMPPTPPSCSSSDSECGGQSPPRTPPLYETLTPQFANPRKGTARILVSSRNPINTPLISSQPKGATGVINLTEEEKRTLLSEGYSVPSRLPLTKSEEKSLKKIRRKIKNKISAQESRRKKKEYMDALERKVEKLSSENIESKRRIEILQASNSQLMLEVQRLQSMIEIDEKSRIRSTPLATLLS
ncbi:cyclic AMP response element-binding protein A-like isoform X2 [Penaeus chinensis]|uniref:cyclic AMP response element-binding protein A-like isoform X2 n=1 Tax=Penaeus chinensis TaxID=139456 RepID=UPI001FB84199|nr:cyclic AMP response element-binding protein A-like isoform X2 [Penaeus chinensis]